MENVIIFGSGRSGTSMVAGALARSGYFMGKNPDYLEKKLANKKGFFEDLEVNTINEDLMKNQCYNWPEKIRRNFFPSHTFYRARWLARISKPDFTSDPEIDARIRKVIANEPFCLKDPRFSYTLPVWQRLIFNVKFLVVYRHPNKTANSIVTECQESPPLRKLKMNMEIALDIWKKMYTNILKNYESSEKNNWYFVHYEQMFREETINDIERFIQARVDRSFMERTLSRSDKSLEDALPGNIHNVYKKLNQLSSYVSI